MGSGGDGPFLSTGDAAWAAERGGRVGSARWEAEAMGPFLSTGDATWAAERGGRVGSVGSARWEAEAMGQLGVLVKSARFF